MTMTCTRKHSNSISFEEARVVTLDELKSGAFSHVYLVGNCGHLMKVKINGKAITWKRNPERVKVPYKYGMYEFGYIRETDKAYVPVKDGAQC